MNQESLRAFKAHAETLPKPEIQELRDGISHKQTDMFQLERILCKIYRGG